MPDPTPVLPESTTDASTYRPLSALAMASIVIAGFYAVIVLTFGIMSFVSGTPVFLPPWGLAVPGVAIVLATTARRQIRTSEGARSGLALATWGWRLALVFGIIHAGIFFGTLLAVGMQAQSELKANFFDKIRDGSEGSLEDAYVFTIPPDQRATREEIRRRFLKMEGGKKGPFARFTEHDIVRILEQGGPNAQIESLGIKSIDPSKDGYNVVQNYRVTTPEGVFVIQFTLRTKDSKDSRKRRWQLLWKETDTLVVSKELTPLGEKMQYWLKIAREFAGNWIMERSTGRLDLAFLDTLSPQVREERQRQFQMAKMAATLAAAAASLGDAGQGLSLARFAFLSDLNLSCALCMPGFQQFTSEKFLDKSNFEASSQKSREQYLTAIINNLIRPGELGFRPDGGMGVIRRVEDESPRLQAHITLEMAMKGGDGPQFMGAAELVVESDRMPESEAGTPQWRIASIKLLAAAPPPSGGGPPGMPPGGMPGMMNQQGRIGSQPGNQ